MKGFVLFRHQNLFLAGLPQPKHTMVLYFCLQFFATAVRNPPPPRKSRDILPSLSKKRRVIGVNKTNESPILVKSICQQSSASLRAPHPLQQKSVWTQTPPSDADVIYDSSLRKKQTAHCILSIRGYQGYLIHNRSFAQKPRNPKHTNN